MTPHGLIRPLLGIAMFAVMAMTPVSSDARVESAGANMSISMTCLPGPGCRFDPPAVTVFSGTTVTWTGADGLHTSTSNSGLWDSGVLLSGQSYPRLFDTPGVFPYNCTLHSLFGMTGTITVIASSNQVFLPFLARESNGL